MLAYRSVGDGRVAQIFEVDLYNLLDRLACRLDRMKNHRSKKCKPENIAGEKDPN